MATFPQTKQEGDEALLGAWDYKGRPAVKSSSGGWVSAAMILAVEACERLTTLGIGVNLVTYLTGTMHLGSAMSANIVTNFFGTSFMLCLLGGFLADTYLGRYFTVGIFATVQAAGVTILTISTNIPSLRPPKCDGAAASLCVPASGKQLGILYAGLYLTALGTGGIKSSVSGFGSDQFDEADPAERKRMVKFFNWFYFGINIGSLGAVTVLVYIQDNVGRKWGYGICACAIVCGLMLFLSGTRRYRLKKLSGSPLTQIASVFVAAWRKRRLDLPSDPSLLFDVDAVAGPGKRKQRLPHSNDFRFLDRAAIMVKHPLDQKPTGNQVADKWHLSTVTDVEEVKLVIRMLPTWATTIIFWTVYAQMSTFSVSQAATMERRIGNTFQIPAASLTAFFVLGILLTIPIYERLIFPIFRPLVNNPNGLSPLQRIAVGLLLSVLAMMVAALTEIKRLRVAWARGPPRGPDPVPMTVFWLVPQFLLVGCGEAFTYVGQLDFFLSECPRGMKTMSAGLFLSTLSLGFFFSSALVTAVDRATGRDAPWLADNLNDGRLYDFYWLLMSLNALNLVVFGFCARRYVYKEKRLGAEEAGAELDEEMVCH